MYIKHKGQKIVFDLDLIKESRQAKAYVFIQTLKIKKQKEKAIDLLLKNREMVAELLSKSDDELKEIKKEVTKDKPLYDRGDIKGARIPFTF